MQKSERLTDNEVRKALSPKQGQRIIWDGDVKGFGVRITARGAKSFILDYRSGQRQRRLTIGAYPDWTVAAARKIASEHKKDIDKGADPMGARQNLREAPTMQDLWERYRDEWLPRKALTSRKNETSMWEKIVLPKLGKETLVSIEATDIDKLHHDITTVK
jgi:hypothetical protein